MGEIYTRFGMNGLHFNDWVIQTLTFAYMAKFPGPTALIGPRSHTAANIVYMTITQHVREKHQSHVSALDPAVFCAELVKAAVDAAHLLQLDSLVVPGICRYCGCIEIYGCRLRGGHSCSWYNLVATNRTICSHPECIRKAGPAGSGCYLTFPCKGEPSPIDPPRPRPADKFAARRAGHVEDVRKALGDKPGRSTPAEELRRVGERAMRGAAVKHLGGGL
jgi:hypothetical protein